MLKGAKRNNKTRIKIKIFAGIFLLLSFFVILSLVFIKILFFKPLFISPLGVKINISGNELESDLYKSKIDFSRISVASDSSYLIILTDGAEVNISQKKNIKEQVSSLQLILSRLTIEGKRFKSLDFRFDKPIVIF